MESSRTATAIDSIMEDAMNKFENISERVANMPAPYVSVAEPLAPWFNIAVYKGSYLQWGSSLKSTCADNKFEIHIDTAQARMMNVGPEVPLMHELGHLLSSLIPRTANSQRIYQMNPSPELMIKAEAEAWDEASETLYSLPEILHGVVCATIRSLCLCEAHRLRRQAMKLCCARCTKPIQGDSTKIGKYTYGPCCIEIVKARKEEKCV